MNMSSCRLFDGSLTGECLETILDTMGEAVFLCDVDSIIAYANNSAVSIIGLELSDIIGRKICDILPCPDYVMRSTCILSATTGIVHEPCRIIRPDGLARHLIRNARVIIRNGEMTGIVETLTDITDLKETENRLARLSGDGTSSLMHGMVGKSPQLLELFGLIDMAAASNVSVLVTGETGTGKELVARAIHDTSPRSSKPFVKVNCSALTESLLESELFGHAKGAFTGAIKDKIGRFEATDGGTLFLDEIGEISPLIQIKLLRFLAEHEFERVGESTTRKSDVRIIAATHRTLRDMVRAGTFREDLFYRLKVFPLHLPPLRERKEDISLLVSHFIERFNRETGKKLSGLTRDGAITLMDYCWPGNIRELEHAIEHAFVTCRPEQAIDIFDLPVEIRKAELRNGICRTEPTYLEPKVAVIGSHFKSPRSISREDLLMLLARNDWNKNAVADALGIDRTTLWRKMKKFGIPSDNNS